MQKIDNIEIKNFKSIRHQKLKGVKELIFLSAIRMRGKVIYWRHKNYHVDINELINA
jgi:AAA15 family ATPase/GTPase